MALALAMADIKGYLECNRKSRTLGPAAMCITISEGCGCFGQPWQVSDNFWPCHVNKSACPDITYNNLAVYKAQKQKRGWRMGVSIPLPLAC